MTFVKIMNEQNCKVCGEILRVIPPGISKKTGKAYNSFTACPKGCKTNWNTPAPQTPRQDANGTIKEDANLLIMEELGDINRKLDKLVEFLIDKLGSDKQGLPSVSKIPY